MSSTERCARVGELELCYQAFGPGTLPPLLLVMGLASQMVLWDDEFCQALANRGLRAIRFELRRVGRTDPSLYLRMLRRARVDREGYVQDFIATYRAIGSRTYPPDPARSRALAGRCFERGIHPDVAARQLAAIIAAPDRTLLLPGREDGCTRAAAARRAESVRERTGVSLKPVSSHSFDPEGAAGNIEHFIGVAQEPIGLAGPLLVNGEHARGGFCVAMATAEGTLMAGHNRRGGLLDEAGGVTTVMHDHMQRAPSFLFPSARAARANHHRPRAGLGRMNRAGAYPRVPEENEIMRNIDTLPALLRAQASRVPDQPFVRWRGRTVSYAEFDVRTDALAAGLAELGVQPGDVVSVMLPNRLELIEAWWAILKAGAVFGPINPALTAAEAAYVLGHSHAKAIVTDSRGVQTLADERDAPELQRLRHMISVDGDGELTLDSLAARGGPVPRGRPRPGDLAEVLYTSGTTGKPKGAMLTHGNILANTAMGAELLPLVAGERVGMILPLFHVNAQVVTCVIPIMIGCEVVMWERFSASTFWQAVAELEPVAISAVPTILAAVLHTPDAPAGRTSLRYVNCGAAPLSRELLEAFENRFDIRILEGYGLTESTCISSVNPYYGVRKPGSIGLPVRGQQMKIVAPDGSAAEDGELGEIVVKGPNVMAGYLHNPEATAGAIRDGWLHTGDVGYVDSDGYFFIVDRSKDMIIRGGENIYPREIEEVLYAHAGVLECAVIGIPDEVRGEEVLAVVAPKPGAELEGDELRAFAAERLAAFKVPRRVEVRAALPKNATGKILKQPLREEFGYWAAGG